MIGRVPDRRTDYR